MPDPIIEAAERALEEWDSYQYPEMALAVLAAVTPLIRAEALEEAALRIEADEEDYLMRSEIAAAIRTLKEKPAPSM